MKANVCAVPACTAQTLRVYCIRCEINGQAAEHLRRSQVAAADEPKARAA